MITEKKGTQISKPLLRPTSAKNENSFGPQKSLKTQVPDFSEGLVAEKIKLQKKGYKPLPKNEFKPVLSNQNRRNNEIDSELISDSGEAQSLFDESVEEQKQTKFEEYMKGKMQNPEIRKIYSNLNSENGVVAEDRDDEEEKAQESWKKNSDQQKHQQDNDELQQVTSKPFTTCQDRFHSAQNSQKSYISSVSTERGSETVTNQDQHPSTDMENATNWEFKSHFTTTTATNNHQASNYNYSQQTFMNDNQSNSFQDKQVKMNQTGSNNNTNTNQFIRLTDLTSTNSSNSSSTTALAPNGFKNSAKQKTTNPYQTSTKPEETKDDGKIKFDPTQWKVISQHVDPEQQKRIKELSQFVTNIRKQHVKNFPKDFDNMVEITVDKLKHDPGMDSSQVLSNLQLDLFRKNDIQGRNQAMLEEIQEMNRLDLELAQRERVNEDSSKRKIVDRLNSMQDESIQSMNNLNSEELKNRAAFITEFLQNRSGVNKQQSLEEMIQNDEQSLIMYKQLTEKMDGDDENDIISSHSFSQYGGNNKDQYFVQKNIIQAGMTDLQRLEHESICNNLPDKAKERLDELLKDIEKFNLDEAEAEMLKNESNPFKTTDEIIQKLSELDEKLADYANNLKLIDEQEVQSLTFNDDILPQDKTLRQEAENRIIQKQMTEINSRLRQIAQSQKELITNKAQIQMLVQKILDSGLVNYDEQVSKFWELKLLSFDELEHNNNAALQQLESLKKEGDIVKQINQMKIQVEELTAKFKAGLLQDFTPSAQSPGNEKNQFKQRQSEEEKDEKFIPDEVVFQELEHWKSRVFQQKNFLENERKILEDIEKKLNEKQEFFNIQQKIDQEIEKAQFQDTISNLSLQEIENNALQSIEDYDAYFQRKIENMDLSQYEQLQLDSESNENE